MLKFRLASIGALLSLLIGCAHVNSVSLTPIPAQRSHVVKAEATKWVFLAFNFNNDFVDGIVTSLKDQCPNGVVSGILTKDETIMYVVMFKRNVVATGYCNTVAATPDVKVIPPKGKKS